MNVTFEELDPGLNVEQLEKHAMPVIKEYFNTGDLREAIVSFFLLSVRAAARKGAGKL